MTAAPAKSGAVSPTATLRLGVRAHDFGCLPADELAARIAAQGFTCVQLALNKAIAGLNLQAGDLTTEMARDIGVAFRRHGVQIAVLGCYINPIHPDPATRTRLLNYFKDHLRFARDFGCPLVALESGSVNSDYSPHPDNHGLDAFNTLLESLGDLVSTAEAAGVNIGLEAVTSHTVSTPRKMRAVLDTLRSAHLQVVLDPVNLLYPGNVARQTAVFAEAVELFGDRVGVIHAKDYVVVNGQLQTVPAGSGQLDYGPVLRFVRKSRPTVVVLLEEANEAVAPDCAVFLQEHYLKANL